MLILLAKILHMSDFCCIFAAVFNQNAVCVAIKNTYFRLGTIYRSAQRMSKSLRKEFVSSSARGTSRVSAQHPYRGGVLALWVIDNNQTD